MFSQIQMIIAAIVLTVGIAMGGTIWFLYGSLDKKKQELLTEKIATVTLTEQVKDMELQVQTAHRLLNEANDKMTEIRYERDKAKSVLQDSSRLAKLAKARATLVSRLARDATARLWTDFENISKETADTLP